MLLTQERPGNDMGVIGIGLGTATMGRRQIDANGKVINETPARWELDPAGGCVAIWPMNLETGQPDGAAEIFGDYDAAGYLARVLEHIRPNRPVNLPDLPAIVKAATEDDVDLCEYCPRRGFNCSDCIMNTWKGGNDDE